LLDIGAYLLLVLDFGNDSFVEQRLEVVGETLAGGDLFFLQGDLAIEMTEFACQTVKSRLQGGNRFLGERAPLADFLGKPCFLRVQRTLHQLLGVAQIALTGLLQFKHQIALFDALAFAHGPMPDDAGFGGDQPNFAGAGDDDTESPLLAGVARENQKEQQSQHERGNKQGEQSVGERLCENDLAGVAP
jgi:hypothetical protein